MKMSSLVVDAGNMAFCTTVDLDRCRMVVCLRSVHDNRNERVMAKKN